MGISLFLFFLVFLFLTIFILLAGLTLLLETLDQESTRSSGMLVEDQITLFIYHSVNMTRQIHHIISISIFYFLGIPAPFATKKDTSVTFWVERIFFLSYL